MLRFAAAAVLFWTFTPAAFADLIIEARQVGDDVVFTTSGSLDFTGWASAKSTTTTALVPSQGRIYFGAPPDSDLFTFGSTIAPSDFGSGGGRTPNSTSGDPFSFAYSFENFGTAVWVEAGYQFGDPIDATMTFENISIDALGMNEIDTVWSWNLIEPGSLGVRPVTIGTSSITLRAIAIPEPSAFACLGLIGLVASGQRWWKRRR